MHPRWLPFMTIREFITRGNRTVDDDELIQDIWASSLTVKERVTLSLELNDIRPSYETLTTMWLEYELTREVTHEYNETIFSHYQFQLSNSDKDLSTSTEYSLYFDIFEDPDRKQEAWDYFLKSSPTKKFIKVMLACSGPVPYDLKHKLYQELLADTDFHINIYISIRHSCFDNCGQIDRTKARDILYKLKLDDKVDQITNSDKYRTFSDVAQYIKD
jgi:hypothetical protein